MRILSLLKIAGVIFAFYLYGCSGDAPRDNPLDPVNGIRLSGSVVKLLNNGGIENAMLTLVPGNKTALSDASGTYVFENINADRYRLICRAEGFAPDSIQIDIAQTSIQDFVLNRLPAFQRLSVSTEHILRFAPPGEEYSIRLEAGFLDEDDNNLVNRAWFDINDINYQDTMRVETVGTERFFFQKINVQDLNIFSLEQLIGKPFRFYIDDSSGTVLSSGDHFITRFIDKIPVTVSPSDTSVSFPILFTWNDPQQLFAFSYTIEILQFNEDETDFNTVDCLENIPSHIPSFTYTRSQPPGEYFWVLYIVDEFGNRSRSTPKPFIIF